MHDWQLPCVDEVKLKGDQIECLHIYLKYIPRFRVELELFPATLTDPAHIMGSTDDRIYQIGSNWMPLHTRILKEQSYTLARHEPSRVELEF